MTNILDYSLYKYSHITSHKASAYYVPPSPSLGTFPMNMWKVLNNHSQVGQSIRMGGGTNNMENSALVSPNHSSPSIVCMQPVGQPFAINSTAGFGMNHNHQAFGMNSSISSDIFGREDVRGNILTGLDSELSSLVDGRSQRKEEGSCGNPTQFVGMVPKPSHEQTKGFSIYNEDFPALPVRDFKRPNRKNNVNSTPPGFNYRRPTLSNDVSKANLNSTSKSTVSNAGGPMFPRDKTISPQNDQKKGIQVLPGGRVTNIPSGMVMDQFGMIGLLTFLRAAQTTDPGIVHLALGIDPTTLGIDFDSTDNVYPKFVSPWDASNRDIDFHVHIRDKLPAIKLARYGEDLLFYLYYMHGGELRRQSAEELFNQDWRYHREERVWITKVPCTEPTLKTHTYERGTYYFFDWLNWKKVAKEFHLEYDKLERRPCVPTTLNYNPAQQQAF